MKQHPENQATGASETARLFRTPIPSAAGVDSEVMHSPDASRAHTHARGMSYGDINNIPLSVIPRACAHAHEGNGKAHSESALAQWRTNTFGGDFDPVRAVVDDAVDAFSSRQPQDDRRIWMKIANEIGYEAFRDLYLEQLSIMRECKLRNPASAFQNRLNRYTGHNSSKGGAR